MASSTRRHEIYKEMMASTEKPKPRVEEDMVPQERLNDGNEKKGPLIVRFPRQTTSPVEPVKLEAEEAVESKPARNMVQVYLMAAYLVGRWAWARYKERQTRGKSDDKRSLED